MTITNLVLLLLFVVIVAAAAGAVVVAAAVIIGAGVGVGAAAAGGGVGAAGVIARVVGAVIVVSLFLIVWLALWKGLSVGCCEGHLCVGRRLSVLGTSPAGGKKLFFLLLPLPLIILLSLLPLLNKDTELHKQYKWYYLPFIGIELLKYNIFSLVFSHKYFLLLI